ncbi:MAG: hypothetical protein MUE72_05920 [Chitinophagaceae bacterium]|nr:hypothetical protein [Chitinophagaceae bacterium]
MKHIILTVFSFIGLCICSYSQNGVHEILVSKAKRETPPIPNFTRKFITVGGGYELGLPMSSMQTGMSPVHSISVSSSLPLSFITPNLQLGIDLAYGLYGAKRFGVNYRQNGNYINTAIQYSSDIAQGGIHANYLFLSNKKIQPYITGKLGYAELSSSFMVEDPRDPEACRALESETIHNDGTLYWGYGLGFRWNVGTNTNKTRNFIDFSITQTRGNNVDYVNTNHLHDHNAPPTPTDDSKPINVVFVNASNQNIHQHRIAELYNNPFNILQIKVGYVAYLRLKRR